MDLGTVLRDTKNAQLAAKQALCNQFRKKTHYSRVCKTKKLNEPSKVAFLTAEENTSLWTTNINADSHIYIFTATFSKNNML